MGQEEVFPGKPKYLVPIPDISVVNRWYYPHELANDLETSGLSKETRDEVLATAWEYTRCVIPEFTNWSRYLAFVRVIAMCTLCEFRGDLFNVVESRQAVGYDADAIADDLFKGTPG